MSQHGQPGSNIHTFNRQGRPKHACRECQTRKRKCHVHAQDSPCKRCIRFNVSCSLVAPMDPANDSCTETVDSSSGIFPSQEVCNELVDLYFDVIHDKDHALFHRPSFIADQRQGLADMMHVSAMIALGARFSSNRWFENSERWNRGRVWADHSRRLFDSRKQAVSLAAIQACILLCTIAFCDGDMERESLYSAQAIRMIQLKDLPDSLSKNTIQRETEIRVWWTVWMFDNWASAGARIPRQLTVDPNFPVPMEEHAFELLSPECADLAFRFLPETTRLREYGLWAQMIPLTEVIAPINEIHEMTVQNRLTDIELFDRVKGIARKLDSWKLNLPSTLQMTSENLKSYADTGHARILAALHTGYHHFNQLLYYQFLQQSTSSATGHNSNIFNYATRCREHAAELSKLLWLTNQTPGCECMWPMISHLLAISSSVHLHSLLFDDDETRIANAKHMLEQNFEMMITLRQFWPSIDLSMSRLRVFHQACQQSMNTTFNMDHWMLQFLQRYTKPVAEREVPVFLETEYPTAIWPTLPLNVAEGQTSTSNYNIWYNQPDHSIGSRILQSFL